MSANLVAEPTVAASPPKPTPRTRPRVGFLGVGWIGQHRLAAIARSGAAEVAAIADPAKTTAVQAARGLPEATVVTSLEDLFSLDLDAVVIATPSAQHAAQTIQALERGLAVFCQKPLGRTADETRDVIAAARAADRLLDVDLSYRFVTEIRAVRDLIERGALGEVFAAELVFHNAYGPDKSWYYDRAAAGGGCVIDLGIHLVDLALWTLGFPRVENVSSRLFSHGQPIAGLPLAVEDYATARLDLATGAAAQLACSWKLPAGCDAVIAGSWYGTQGGAGFRNLEGSFYRFTAERFRGTQRETLAATNDEWGGLAAVDWARRLARNAAFDPAIERLNDVAAVLDRMYRR